MIEEVGNGAVGAEFRVGFGEAVANVRDRSIVVIGQAVDDLTLMAKVLSDEDLRNRVEFLPL